MAKNPRLKQAYTQTEYTQHKLIELQKCMNDPIYFIENYLYIIHPVKGRVLFKLYDFQKELILAFKENRFNIAKISRQSGKSQLSAAWLLFTAMYTPNQTILIAANKLANAKEILSRIENMYQELDSDLKIGISEKEWNKTSLAFENGSKIIAQATGPNTGRGFSISLLYLDEFSFVNPWIAKELWASLYPVISTGGKMIITSTPSNVPGDLFQELFLAAKAGSNNFKYLEFDWTAVPGRDEKFKTDTIAALSLRTWLQEFECQFLSSDKSLIDGIKLERAENTIRPIEATLGELYNQDFWKLPHRNGTYIIGVDPSQGTGNDYSVIEVFEFPSMEQIMEYRTNDQSPATLYSILKTIVTFFEKNSLMTYYSVESNTLGQAIIALYETDEKPPLNAVFMAEDNSDKLGFYTTNSSKMKALINLKELFERDNMKFNSKILINELKYLVRKDNTFKAQTGYTDDCVMAVMICIRIMTQMAEYDMNAYSKLYSHQNVTVDPWAVGEEKTDDTSWEEDYMPYFIG